MIGQEQSVVHKTGILCVVYPYLLFSSSTKVDTTNSKVLKEARSVKISICGTGSTFNDLSNDMNAK